MTHGVWISGALPRPMQRTVEVPYVRPCGARPIVRGGQRGSWIASDPAGTYPAAGGSVSEPPAWDVVEKAAFGVMCMLAASLPNDSVLGGYDPESGVGLRSPSYYLGILAAGLRVLFLPRLLQLFMRCRALQLMVGATTTRSEERR